MSTSLLLVAPSRGRGSKRVGRVCPCGIFLVAPSRGRGSKPSSPPTRSRCRCKVAPSRGRGSKLPHRWTRYLDVVSPPHGGADRNRSVIVRCNRGQRRPLTGARIETSSSNSRNGKSPRRPLTGARIETLDPSSVVAGTASPPHGGADRNFASRMPPACPLSSPPHGGADRNEHDGEVIACRSGRPLTGARIETRPPGVGGHRPGVAPSRGADRNHYAIALGRPDLESPPHGGADRNADKLVQVAEYGCRPLTGARIETL